MDTSFQEYKEEADVSQIGESHIHKPETPKFSMVNTKSPPKKKFANPTGQVPSNHFEVSWGKDTKFYVYEIADVPAGNKRKTETVTKTIEAFGKPIGDRSEAGFSFRNCFKVDEQLQQASTATHVVYPMNSMFGVKFDLPLKAVSFGIDDEPVLYP